MLKVARRSTSPAPTKLTAPVAVTVATLVLLLLQATCVVTTAVVPGLTQVTQNVQVAERGEYRYPWVNLLDLRVAKSFEAGGTRIEPTLDLYNVFNNNAVTNAVQTLGTSLGRPSSIVMGRLLRLGGRISF